MVDPTSRALRLLSLMQGRRDWAGADLAGRLGVSLRTLRRDVDRLRELGYPVEARPGVDGGYRLAAGAALPPLVLDDDEAVALTVGLQAAAAGAGAGMAEASVRALTKVVPVLPARLRRRVEALRAMTVPAPPWSDGGPAVDPGVLVAAAQACRETERLEFTYTAAGGRPAERLVEPHRLVPLGHRWYLVAYDPSRGDWRTFRLDRMSGLGGTGARFAPRPLPAEDAAAFVRAGMDQFRTPTVVEAVVEAPAAVVRDRVGRWVRVTDEGPDRCRLHLETDDLDWPALVLGAVRAEFTVVAPEELRVRLAEWSQRFARAVAG
ncbi:MULTISPECIES: helix-turn-helix transcriptional regulator [unclassified Modestobacter]|uniref:helix-turn-helix transcriptional regulator n=1 Tax=unclassified Modestobacter TaxID=2643866 RepID=UPI0022AADAF9|nr:MULTISPECIES: YafY family protein [unclassified Modestobacter]MCZ2826775.1 YafY family protein [Modestobacter sp. VKM Ac-2981]MCZ2855155.1 YafY family protein [Modestobacter sp. VKM Ac-2982]